MGSEGRGQRAGVTGGYGGLMESLWGHYGVGGTMGSMWGHYRVLTGSLWGLGGLMASMGKKGHGVRGQGSPECHGGLIGSLWGPYGGHYRVLMGS